MKTVEKKLNKSQIITICLLIASILLLASYFTVSAIAKKIADKNAANEGAQLPEIFEGESLYLNRPVAYPKIEEYEILHVNVKNADGEFGLTRSPDDQSSFLLHEFKDGSEEPVLYIPPIYGVEGDYSYENFYSVETGDGYGMMYYLTYLCSAIGTPYYSERIAIPANTEENKEKRDLILLQYGLTSSSSHITFEYGRRDSAGNIIEGSKGYHVVVIGDKAVSGSGYYFMVDNRDCVYYTGSEYFKYALAGFNEYVKGTIVAPGLSSDPGISAALTPDFKTWAGQMYDQKTDAIFITDSAKYQDPVISAIGNTYIPIDKGVEYKPEKVDFDGYTKTQGSNLRFPLEELKIHSSYNRIKNLLVGKTVGDYVGESAILLTLISELYEADAKSLDFSEAESVAYTYHISKIESVITDNGERTVGVVEAADKQLKVTYRYTVGEATTAYDTHAVIDVSLLSETDAAKLVGLTLGQTLDTGVDISVSYTKDNSLVCEEKFVLASINYITDENGLKTDVITDKCKVNISYYRTVNGVKSDLDEFTFKISDIEDGSKLAPLKTDLIGMGCGKNIDKVVYSGSQYYEWMREFSTYEITKIDYFTVNELIVSFEYYNASEWDPYYGETYYKNTLPSDTGYDLYGLNADSCEQVIKYLTGMGTDSNSTGAIGLSGKTVAVGLNADTIKDYKLYSHKIYIELPRGIKVLEDESDIGSSESTSDYAWDHVLGFTLYISDPIFVDGKRVRYIGSDMYDTVVMIDATNFDFLELGFVEFWASRNVIMMDIRNIEEIDIEFNMSDYKGRYDFDVDIHDAYVGYIDGVYVTRDEKFDGSKKIEEQIVNVTVADGSFETELKKLANAAGGNEYSMHGLYNHTQGDGNMTYYPGSNDTLGSAYFNSVYEVLMLTRYHSTLTEEEKVSATSDPIFRIHIKVEGKDNYFTYDFYRISDRKVMVSLYRSDAQGNPVGDGIKVSDFYISTFAFKKLASNYVALLNGEVIDPTVGYPY